MSCRCCYRVNSGVSAMSTRNRKVGSIAAVHCPKFRHKRMYILSSNSESAHKSSECVKLQIYRPVQLTPFPVFVKLPDGCWRKVFAKSGQKIEELLSPIFEEFCVKGAVVKMNSNESTVDLTADAVNLRGEKISIEASLPFAKTDTVTENARYSIVEEMLATELLFEQTLLSKEKCFRELLCEDSDDMNALLDWTNPLCSLSKLLQRKLQMALETWTPDTKIGPCFSKYFWQQFEDVLQSNRTLLSFVQEKESQGGEQPLKAICRIRERDAQQWFASLFELPFQRLTQYEKYLCELVTNTDSTHCDFVHLSRCNKRVKAMVNMSPYLREDDKKLKKGRTLNWPFKRNTPKTHTSEDAIVFSPNANNKLFGQQLVKYMNNGTLVTPILNMLRVLRVKGPYTVGIFRKSANARICRELKAKLDETPNSSLEEFPVTVVASVFKEFLRSLPDCLLQSKLYYKWIEAVNVGNNFECREKVSKLLRNLPSPNLTLLRHFVCVLWHISKRSVDNKMCSLNLAVCIGPSLLCNKQQPSILRCEEISKQVPKLVSYLIDHCPELFGESTLRIFEDYSDVYKLDSGAEESDSLKSLQDNGVPFNGINHNRRDDSSIDSLERFSMDDSSALNTQFKRNSAFENKMSLSNLSRDSGLTLSDTQLYTPEDECDSSNIPGVHLDSRLLPHLTKSVPHHLDSTDLENVINVTYSYGRSVGVSIDGSCHDVVRKRRHQDFSGKRHAAVGILGCSRKDNQPLHTRTNHLPIQCTDSCYCPNQSVENSAMKRNEHCCPRNSRYRHRRPPLTAVLRNDSTVNPSNALRRSTSDESVHVTYEMENRAQETNSLPYNFARSETEIDVSHSEASDQITQFRLSHSEEVNVRSRKVETHQNGNIYSQSNLKFSTQKMNTRVGSTCSSNSSDTASQHSLASKMSSHSSNRSVTLSTSPPSYQETMSRKEIFARFQNNSVSSRCISSTSPVSSSHIYEQSVRVYTQDLQKGSNIFMRAVPVRVKCNDSDSDNDTIQNKIQHKQPLCRISSEIKSSEMTPLKKPLRFCNSVKTQNANENCNVAIEERCAKDLENDWRKEVSWSVAQLRTFFSKQSMEENPIKRIEKKSPVDTTINEQSAKNNMHDILDENKRHNKENCVTVIQVSQSEQNDNSKDNSKRLQQQASSEEESYV